MQAGQPPLLRNDIVSQSWKLWLWYGQSNILGGHNVTVITDHSAVNEET